MELKRTSQELDHKEVSDRICPESSCEYVFSKIVKPDIVFHAAAHKRMPLMKQPA